MKSIRKEIETLEKAGIINERNFSLVKYIDKKGEERPCYQMNKFGAMQNKKIGVSIIRIDTPIIILYLKFESNDMS